MPRSVRRARQDDDSSMLSTCTAPGCTTVVFGRGTCVDHDPRPATVADHLLAEAASSARTASEPPEAAAKR